MEECKKNNICVYFHINPIKQEVFYVGIGNSIRPYTISDRKQFWKKTVKKYSYIVVVIHNNLSWKEAVELEIKYIKQIGRRDKKLGTLVNHTDGGEGTLGVIQKPWTEERKKEQSLKLMGKNKGKPRPKEVMERVMATKKSRVYITSEETRKKMSENSKGKNNSFYNKIHSEESKKKISETKRNQKLIREKSHLYGKKMSEEVKNKLKLAYQNKSDEDKQRFSNIKKGNKNPFYGKTHTKEVLEKMCKKIIQKDLKGNIIKIWNSGDEAAKTLGISRSGISNAVNKHSKSSNGFIWEKL